MASKLNIRNRIRSFGYAINGIKLMFRNQPNFYIHIVLAIIALGLAYLFQISKSELLWIILAIGLVLSAEIINTSIEKLTDLVQPEHDERAGQIKDLAAAAVLLLAITSFIIGLVIFLPPIISLIRT